MGSDTICWESNFWGLDSQKLILESKLGLKGREDGVKLKTSRGVKLK